jgi:hypothetical protein
MNCKRTIGIDTAKLVFFLHGENESGKVILREKLTREQLFVPVPLPLALHESRDGVRSPGASSQPPRCRWRAVCTRPGQ